MEQLPRQDHPARGDLRLPDEPASSSASPDWPPTAPAPATAPVEIVPLDWDRIERRRRLLAFGLFVATCLSVFYAGRGAGMFKPEFYQRWNAWVSEQTEEAVAREGWKPLLFNGLMYAVPLMAILIAHEGGHWLLARIHGVPATVPFFIPFPISPIGTMGAVILQDGRRADRRALFDIAIAGPLAGLVLALPIAWMGVQLSEWKSLDPRSEFVVSYGDPLVLKWMVRLVHGPLPDGADVMLNPLLFAGWVGIFVTALNLMPIGQLDGGHILYTLVGKWAHRVAVVLLAGGVALMIWFESPAYALMAMLLIFTGPRHPPTANDRVPLGPVRVVLGWLTLAFIVIGFTPTPITTYSADPPKAESVEQPPLEASIVP